MSELKPCPFCGWEKAKIYSKYAGTTIRYIGEYQLTAEARRFYVRCNRCYAHGGTATGLIKNAFVRASIARGWLDNEDYNLIFLDQQEDPDKPELPAWVTTKEAMEEKAAEAWNRRKINERVHKP